MPRYQQKRSLKTLLIDPQMQKEYTFLMVVILFVAAIIISVIVNWTINDTMLRGPYQAGKASPYEVMSTINYLLTVRIILALLITVVVSSFFSIKFLHRVGGPMYRFRATLKQMAGGQIPTDVQLRRNDFYRDMAEEINRVLSLLRSKKKKKEEILSALEAIPSSQLSSDTSKKLNEIISELKQQ
jgi:hypothetical protein